MPTEIQWCDEVWNPTVGCSRVSPGCDNCYAIRVAAREMQPAHEGLTTKRPALDWTGEVRELPDRLEVPFRWKKPRRVFVDSMSDLFHADDEYMARVFAVMSLTPQHTYQVLTKRHRSLAVLEDSEWHYKVALARLHYIAKLGLPERMLPVWPIPNVWLGVSVENQRYANIRIPHLLAAPAAVRFLSIEPLLGPVDLDGFTLVTALRGWRLGDAGEVRVPVPRVDWVIVGGESGPGARPMHPEWVRDIRDQCVAARVPFFFKQWGEYAPLPVVDGVVPKEHRSDFGRRSKRIDGVSLDDHTFAVKVGKKAAGRELDGRTWDEYPT